MYQKMEDDKKSNNPNLTPTNNESNYKKTSENISKNTNNFFSNIKSTVTTVDPEQQEQPKPNAPKTVFDGVAKGLFSLGSGIVGGAKGVFVEPYVGAKQNGVAGFAKGIVRGVGGIVILPVVGVAELVSNTTQGIINTPLTVIEAMKNAPKEEVVELTVIENPLFIGVNLEESIKRAKEKNVPHLITICLEFLSTRTNHEGIFRLSGSKTEIDKLHASFDKGEIKSAEQLDPFMVNEIAGVFKAYFRFQPDPIIPEKTIKKLLEIQSKQIDQSEKIAAFHNVIVKMPEPFYTVLYKSVYLLTKIAENSKESLMTPGNLSIVFGVAWLRPDHSQGMQVVADSNTVVFNFISNFSQIFTKTPASHDI